MNTPKVSVLVPVYKVEPYLQRCIDSVLSQDFTDYELILVDDGSPDRCPEICDQNAAKDERIKVVHKENGGLVSARLAGFKEARAEYLIFLDSDDYLYPHAIYALYNKIIEGYDIVRGRDNKVSQDDFIYGIEETKYYSGVLEGEEYIRAYIMREVAPYLWGAIYKRSLFSEDIFRNFLFVSRQEDWVTQISIAPNVQKVCYIDEVTQAYMVNDSSIMQSCITDYSYVQKIGEAFHSTTKSLSPKMQHLIECDRIAELDRCFFFPELPFDWQVYRKMREFLSDNENLEIVTQMTDKKFLEFVQYPLLFWAYTRVYNILFKYLKLRGKNRKVLI
ncbi:MAG: glycosyltransferase family 2 protein [Prevotella sp.]|nr:glycosyltransferase family 2 protein [Prevotella sp.]